MFFRSFICEIKFIGKVCISFQVTARDLQIWGNYTPQTTYITTITNYLQ